MGQCPFFWLDTAKGKYKYLAGIGKKTCFINKFNP